MTLFKRDPALVFQNQSFVTPIFKVGGVPKKFAEFKIKHLCWSLFLNKVYK